MADDHPHHHLVPSSEKFGGKTRKSCMLRAASAKCQFKVLYLGTSLKNGAILF